MEETKKEREFLEKEKKEREITSGDIVLVYRGNHKDNVDGFDYSYK